MGNNTNIEWTDATWNPWQGCHHVSPGCENCYMFREKKYYGQNPDVVVRSKPPTFNLPLKMKEPQKVFTCSWSDFFIKEADPWRDEAWEIIRNTPHLTYQILTKRIERAASRLPWGDGKPWPNVWLIASIEDQETADRRLPILLRTNAAVRGVSMEPLLGPVDLELDEISIALEPDGHGTTAIVGPLHWIIVGGESGTGARPMHPDWARSIRDQCQEAGVPYFFKQWGQWAPITEMPEAQANTLYVSNRKAKPHEDQEAVDECDGRHCRVQTKAIRYDGCAFDITDAGAWEARGGYPSMQVFNIGKKAAGALLDGKEWKEFPRTNP